MDQNVLYPGAKLMLCTKLTNLPFTCVINALWVAVLITVRVTFPPFDLGVGLGALATLPWQQLYAGEGRGGGERRGEGEDNESI